MLDISPFIAQEGGTATRAALLTVMSGHRLTTAVREGQLVRLRPGRYALPALEESIAAAHALDGVVSHRSAALLHGWGVLHEPERPEIIVPTHRRVDRARRRKVQLRYRSLAAEDVADGLTTPLRTAVDVARDLPLTESLPVLDSALRSGTLSEQDLLTATLPRTARTAARRALRLGSAASANPFESGLRALSVEAVGERFVPQPEVELRGGRRIHPDAGCPELRIALEADSHTFHKTRADVVSDCWRYDELTLAGWLVLRFAWEHVMAHPEWVREVIRWAVSLRSGDATTLGLQVA